MNRDKEALAPGALSKLPAFQWRHLGSRVLLTNDWGGHESLTPRQFAAYLDGAVAAGSRLWLRLQEQGLIRDHMDIDDLSRRWRAKHTFLWTAPSLHILVMTLRCNHSCCYCQSAAVTTDPRRYDMSWRTARACVDMAFRSPNESLSLEFQGGEPLLNWPVLERAIDYALAKNRSLKKDLRLSLVSNFSLLDGRKTASLVARGVQLCTSLDGPAAIHDQNRTWLGGDSHAVAVSWIRELMRRYRRSAPKLSPSALVTVTARTLPHPEAVVDEYARLGLRSIFLRPLSPLGRARRLWRSIGYSPARFLRFYARALDRVLEHNRRGRRLSEKTAEILVGKILGKDAGRYMDMRSPCGAAIGQLAYNHDGDVYTCDEGRMLAGSGEKLFRLGNVFKDSYQDLVSGSASKTCSWSSNLECHPLCARCAYRPFCGTCPVHNYQTQGSIWGVMPSNERCAINKGVFDVLFERLRRPGDLRIFRRWLADRRW